MRVSFRLGTGKEEKERRDGDEVKEEEDFLVEVVVIRPTLFFFYFYFMSRVLETVSPPDSDSCGSFICYERTTSKQH